MEAYRGKLGLELYADEIPPPQDAGRIGSLVDCLFEDEEWYDGVVQDVSYEEQNDHEEPLQKMLLVKFYDDGSTVWHPSDQCKYQYPALVWEAGPFWYHYWMEDQYKEPWQLYSEFHYAMQSLARDFPEASPALFTYMWYEHVESPLLQGDDEAVAANDDYDHHVYTDMDPRVRAYMQKNHASLPIYRVILTKDSEKVSNKFRLFELYRNDPVAASVFPTSYGSIREALSDTSADNDDELFFLKDAMGSSGLGIEVLRRSDLAKLAEPQVGSMVIQKAVRNLLTIDEPRDGALFGRRFDIRFHFVVFHGRVFLHTNAIVLWSAVDKPFNPNDPSIENQVPKIRHHTDGRADHTRVNAFVPQMPGDEWRRGVGHFRRQSPPSALDVRAWMEEISISLSKARSTLKPIIEITTADPASYLLVGGDAMILRTTGEAIIAEFNAWPQLGIFDKVEPLRLVLPQNATHYTVTDATIDVGKIKSGYTAELWRDIASLVMELESPEDMDRFREIKGWNVASVGTPGADEL